MFDLCIANCDECNGIEVVKLDMRTYICKETKKILKEINRDTLMEIGRNEDGTKKR